MKALCNLVLGFVAGLAVIGAAQAADLPRKAKAVEYVRVCSPYGDGFLYIPGTETCMRLGGYIRVDTTFNGGVHGQPAWNGDLGQGNRYANYFAHRSRMALTVDTRTATEYGVVRVFGHGDFQFTIDTGTPAVAVQYLFVQFAGFTIGKSASAYATPWQGFPGNLSSNLLGGQNTDTGVANIQYKAEFGDGVSASIGLDDPSFWNRTAVYNLSTGLNAVGVTGNAYTGTRVPEIVGNVRVDQAWGLFQFSAAAHEVSGSYNTLNAATAAPNNLSEISGHPDTKWGGAVMAALQIKNLPTGKGDDIKIDASYAKGATKMVIATSGTSPNFAMFDGSSRGYQSVGFGATTDAVYLPVLNGGTGDLKLTEAYGVRGAFNHVWNADWTTSLNGSASWVRYGGAEGDLTTAKGQYCAVYSAGKVVSGDYSCNPDYTVYQVGVVTRWTPVKNLTFSAEVQYFRIDQNFAGTAVLTPSAPKPTAVYEFKDQDTVHLQLRVQRNF